MTTYGTAGKIVNSGLKQAKRVAGGINKLRETTKRQTQATAKRVALRSTPGVGLNPRGELSTGARALGTGIERGVNTVYMAPTAHVWSDPQKEH